MHPTFRIFADSREITSAVKDRLLELTVTDEAGLKSDQVRLTFDDRRGVNGVLAPLPKMGMKLEISLGYEETGVTKMGVYVVDEVEISHPPATLRVNAKAADMVGPFRSPKTRSWDSTTIGAIVETIASEHGYTPKVSAELAGVAVPHLDQTEESDMAFLTRLAEKHDAVTKPVHGHLVFAKQGTATTAGGQVLPVLEIRADDVTTWSFRQASRSPGGSGGDDGKTGGYRARWLDYHAGITKELTVGTDPFEELRDKFDSEEKARAAATAKLNKGKRGEKTLSLTLPGDPRMAAEYRLRVLLRPEVPTDWRITKAEHTLAGRGYVTQIEAEQFINPA